MESNKLFLSFFLFRSRVNKKGLTPIYLRITVGGKRETLGTGIFIDATSWDEDRGVIKGSDPLVINQNHLLNSLKGKVMGIYTQLLNAGNTITTSAITKKLAAIEHGDMTLMRAIKLHNSFIAKKVGIEATRATLTKYETLRHKVELFLNQEYKGKDPLLHELTQKFLSSFELFLKTKEGIAHNTTTKYLQFLKRIINYSISQEWVQHNPFSSYRCHFKPVLREVLTLPEIQSLIDIKLNTERLRAVRDIFVFSCFTGLAYADVKKLRMEEIVLGVDHKPWIQTYRAKTQTRVPVPLLPQALSLIQQYHEWRQEYSTSRVFPVLSNQKMNAYLKELADLCGIVKPLTFHIARHTFATMSLNNDVPIESVSKMLGHTNIKTTQIYAKINDSKLANDMEGLRKKLL